MSNLPTIQAPSVVIPPPGGAIAIIVQQGRILDFIDGSTQREETPEEYVRQEIAKSLVREYSYAKTDIYIEFTLRLYHGDVVALLHARFPRERRDFSLREAPERC